MIVCISPNYFYMDETINSLKYAQKAKKIKENKNPNFRESLHLLNTNGSLSDKIHIENLEKEIRYLKGILIAKGRCENNPTNRFEESPATPAGYKPRLLSASPAIDSAPALSSQRYQTQAEGQGVEEFDELLEALVENIEDLNALRNNVMEIDGLISHTDEKILCLQESIADSNDYQITQQLYKELRVIADKLEEHLDLKEHALSEIEKLQQTIKCTKLALRRIKSSVLSVPTENPSKTGEDAIQRPSATDRFGRVARTELNQPNLINAANSDPMISSSRDSSSLLEEIRKRDQQIQILTAALKNLQPNSQSKLTKAEMSKESLSKQGNGAWKKKAGGANEMELCDPVENKENSKPNIVKQVSEISGIQLCLKKPSSVESIISLLKSNLNPNTTATTASNSTRVISPLIAKEGTEISASNYDTFRPDIPKLTISAAQSRSNLLGFKPNPTTLSRPSTGSFFLTQEDTGRETHAKPSQQTATFGPFAGGVSSTQQPSHRADKTPDESLSPREDLSDGLSDDDIMEKGLFLHEPAVSDGMLTGRADTQHAGVFVGKNLAAFGCYTSLLDGPPIPEAHHGTSTNPMSLVGANSDRDELYHEEELEEKRNGTLELQPLNRKLCI